MTKPLGTKRSPRKFVGEFSLPGGDPLVGELNVAGANTLLKLYSGHEPALGASTFDIEGSCYDCNKVTLVDCISFGSSHRFRVNEPVRYTTEILPHYVVVGSHHLRSEEPCVSAVHFSTPDLPALFHDQEAFGQVIDATSIFDVVLANQKRTKAVGAGDWPQLFYYTGKACVVEVATAIGAVSVHHQPYVKSPGTWGISVKNRLMVSIIPPEPVSFEDAMRSMNYLACFLAMAAGRTQAIQHIRITTIYFKGEDRLPLDVYRTMDGDIGKQSANHKPDFRDVPLDPVGRREEFETVLSDWLSRHDKCRVPRNQYVRNLAKDNHYDPDRLVAAANMFDHLPVTGEPIAAELDPEVVLLRDACVEALFKLPRGADRDSAIQALKRLGKPSLLKRVLRRVSVIKGGLDGQYAELDAIAKLSIRCRNHFVHGSGDDFDYPSLEPHVPFLTDALEFIFATSDLVESGWDVGRWNRDYHASSHIFARFRFGYAQRVDALRMDGHLLEP